MTKQEFMAMSLPYGLKVKFITERIQSYSATKYEAEFENSVYEPTISIPILRPFSDLLIEIEHKGETFIPIVELAKLQYPTFTWRFRNNRAESTDRAMFKYDKIDKLFYLSTPYDSNCTDPLQVIQKIVEWNFDIAELIESGEAIDYHTLPDFVF